MEALEAIKGRRSTRVFLDKELPKDKIEEIIDAGRLAPSANNVQPWEFIIITNGAVRQAIADLTDWGRFIAQAPVCIAVFCKDTKYYLEDGCAATENILIAAHALGISSCWVAGDKKPYSRKINTLLKVPSSYKLISLLALGYSDVKPLAHGKRALKELLHWEEF